ncbi:hypothetical protein [Cumulibacter manganitolerans]|uniref:hypothetical protein n=1 Tax=Cumulibacter manganitolerans TaxID=1884992 RepID=UPI0012974603|nr:hypothetical protein [Cumulibacter manganitolerans]
MTLEEVAAELYGLTPAEFTAARNARAKAARASGDRQLGDAIQRLRKPTNAAWLVNVLVRRHGEEIGQVIALGEKLREAHSHLEGAQLRTLDQQRRQLIHALSAQVTGLARELGHGVSDKVRAEVEETLHAAMADPHAGAAVSSGLLTDAFEASGLTPVDLDGVTALPLTAAASTPTSIKGSGPHRDRKAERARADAERAVAEAESELRRSEEAVKVTTDAVSDARRHRERLQNERERLEQQLEDLLRDLSSARQAQEHAERQHESAERDEAAARLAAERAQSRLNRLG